VESHFLLLFILLLYIYWINQQWWSFVSSCGQDPSRIRGFIYWYWKRSSSRRRIVFFFFITSSARHDDELAAATTTSAINEWRYYSLAKWTCCRLSSLFICRTSE
jgi:hypothetical protein